MCCDIGLSSSDYNPDNKDCIVCGRTMEYNEPLYSKLYFVSRNMSFHSITPVNKLEWCSKFGYIAIKVLDRVIVDGMNETGFSCGILTLDTTVYSPVTARSISILDICGWLLGLCETVDDAIDLLRSVQIYGEVVPVLNRVIGLHIVIHDRKGMNIVCEISEGHRINIYYTDGVVANIPTYPEQLAILQAYRDKTITISDDISSTARFIKLSELKRVCIPETADGIGLVNLLCHMFNTVDIIKGMASSKREQGKIYNTTHWCFIKDLTSRQIYYRSYNSMTLHHIDMNTIDFSGTKIYPEISIDNMPPIMIDITF